MSDNLRGRVRDQKEKQQNGNGDVEKAAKPQTVYEFIEAMKGEMARALPKHLNADRMARIALTEVRRTPLLARCTQASFGGALMTCAQLGLEPGVSGEAYLLPFKNSKLSREAKRDIYEVQLIIGYQGMAKLFWQSPLARSLDAQAVYKEDDFEYAYGLDPVLKHKPSLQPDRGEAVAYYAVARMSGGGSAFIVMSPGDIQRIRARSRAKDDGPWKTDYDAMARKTCLRQLFKLLPRSPELSQALTQDEAVRTDLSADALDFAGAYPDALAGEVVREVTADEGRSPDEEARLREEAKAAAEEAQAAAAAEGATVEDPPENLFPEPGDGE